MEDNLKSLFEVIRKQDAVLWVGAGFSMYAGYKSGRELSEKFFNLIDISKRDRLNQEDLQKVTQAYTDFNPESGRNELIRQLKNEYINKNPVSKKYHRTLASIPHIRTVLTTNYDRLLELSYKNNAQSIYNDNHITAIDERKVQIIKVHGDLKEPESIILTTDDYGRFFQNGKDRNMWSVVSERIATKTPVFIGYSLEDINVDYILNKIWSNIDSKKQCYLVAPNLSESQKARLKNRGITYINLSGEKFIKKTIQNIKENLVTDFNSKWITTEVFSEFMGNHGMIPNIESLEDKNIITSIRGKNSSIKGSIKMTLNDEKLLASLNDLMSGKSFDELALSVKKFSFDVKGIPIMKNEGVDFLFKPLPHTKYNIDIKFTKIPLEINDIPVEIFASLTNSKIHVNLKQGELIIKVSNENQLKFNFETEHHTQFGKIKDEIEYYSVLLNVFNGNEFVIYFNNGTNRILNLLPQKDMIDHTTFFLDYFKKLKRIEDYFGVRFNKFDIDALNESVTIVNNLIAIIDNKPIEGTYTDDLSVTFDYFDENLINTMSDLENSDEGLVVLFRKPEIIELHNQKLNVGFQKREFLKLYPINLEEFAAKKTYILKFGSKTKKLKISYLKELPDDMDSSDTPIIGTSIKPIE